MIIGVKCARTAVQVHTHSQRISFLTGSCCHLTMAEDILYTPKMCLQPGICPDHASGAYSAPPDPWVDLKGHFASQGKGGERKGKEEGNVGRGVTNWREIKYSPPPQ